MIRRLAECALLGLALISDETWAKAANKGTKKVKMSDYDIKTLGMGSAEEAL